MKDFVKAAKKTNRTVPNQTKCKMEGEFGELTVLIFRLQGCVLLRALTKERSYTVRPILQLCKRGVRAAVRAFY